jgi:hypothetical protein
MMIIKWIFFVFLVNKESNFGFYGEKGKMRLKVYLMGIQVRSNFDSTYMHFIWLVYIIWCKYQGENKNAISCYSGINSGINKS